MKKSKIRRPLLSRKTKTVIQSIFILAALIICIAGSLPITPWAAFRRVEKANLIGPGRILGTEHIGSVGKHFMIVAETDHYYMTYAFRYLDWGDEQDLVYCKKEGDLTFLSVQSYESYERRENEYLPIVLFADYPESVRAELELKPCVDFGNGRVHKRQFSVSAEKGARNYFLFKLDWPDSGTVNSIMKDWQLMQAIRLNLTVSSALYDIPATIRLYDKNDRLILEREFLLGIQDS